MKRYWLLAPAALAAIVLAVWIFRPGDDANTREFFTPATPVPCDEAAPVELDEAKLAAFAGDLTATGEEQLVVVTMLPATAVDDSDRFSLADPGATYDPEPNAPPQTLVFRVPRALGAFKLSYRGACGAREWIVP